MADLNVITLGEGDAPALALHCGLGRAGMWKGVAKHLPGLTLTAPDLPGHGRSAPFPAGVDVHDAATDAVRPLFDRPMHLIGHSFGATVALRLALAAPSRVLSMTLVEPVFFAAAKGADEYAPHRAAEEAFFEVYQTGDMMAAAEAFNALWGGGMPWDGFEPAAQQAMAGGMPFVAATEPSLWEDSHDMLRAGGLEALSCPVTLLRGARSVPIITDVHRGLMARLPNAREVVVDKAGHMVTLTHADQLAQAIAETVALADSIPA
ncbi:alpha/beta fold hydrolase [Tropicibacter naphthalenivorans]|uniref:Dihydrolipoyllysine-residue acetyltransferase component of acetoin cleaving system n=1 Tax=Tropicibacter naphthalenivorans TaxID=441103 RepID=A0A0P1G0F0_9RHOB|nr:alpha/beta hydrolase [Tropicibacter naphthalenivorans]CUH75055.1 Dihydrolipoyllysine-residue acetyltransferase component of acetoin cleaving system [Tropicibacter naphthalenivorans]SMC47043.1 Pimeloyl-ACP methyl ester carboxylesterase [Tropicibacter naphthalenivorans]